MLLAAYLNAAASFFSSRARLSTRLLISGSRSNCRTMDSPFMPMRRNGEMSILLESRLAFCDLLSVGPRKTESIAKRRSLDPPLVRTLRTWRLRGVYAASQGPWRAVLLAVKEAAA